MKTKIVSNEESWCHYCESSSRFYRLSWEKTVRGYPIWYCERCKRVAKASECLLNRESREPLP